MIEVLFCAKIQKNTRTKNAVNLIYQNNSIKTKKQLISELLFAVRTGLEPATSAVTGRHSNQLNYRTK